MKPATPLPLIVWEDAGYIKVQSAPDGPNICECGRSSWPESRLYAAYIAHAANMYPELVTALRNARNVLALALPLFTDESTDEQDSRDEAESVIDEATAVLAKAGEA